MGNIHTVTQIAPQFHKPGAVIRVKEKCSSSIETEFQSWKGSYNLQLERAQSSIVCQNVNEERSKFIPDAADLYLVVRSGATSDYEEDFNNTLNHFAPQLEDACFFIEDEYQGFVREYRIQSGAFMLHTLVEEDGELLDYFERNQPDMKEVILNLLRLKTKELEGVLEHMPKEAIGWLNKYLKLQPDDWQSLSMKGRALSCLEKYPQSIKFLKKAARIKKRLLKGGADDFDCRLLYHAIAYAYLRAELYDDGLRYATLAHEIIPSWGDYRPLECIGFALMAQGKNLEAIDCFNQILRESNKRKDIAYAFYNKACALTKLKKWSTAASCLASSFMLENWRLPKEALNDDALTPLFKRKETKLIMGPEFDRLTQFENDK